MQTRVEEIHLLDYWKIIMNRRHIAVSFFAVIVGIVTVYSFVATPLYQSTVKLLVNQENNTTLSFAEGGSPQIQIKDPTEYYNTQKKILFSRAFMDRVVRKYSLAQNPYFIERKKAASRGIMNTVRGWWGSIFASRAKTPPAAASGEPAELDPWLTDVLLRQMTVDVGRDSNIMEIHFTADNPGMSASVANAIAQAYIEYNLDLRLTPYKNSVQWLSSRLAELRDKLEASEKSLQRYKERTGIVTHEAKESILTQKLQGLVTELVRVQGARQEAEVKYQQIKNVVDNPERLETVPDIMNNLVIQGLRNEELRLRRQVSEMSEKYGPKHPQMIKTKSELEMVQKNLVSEARKMLNAAKTEYEIALNKEKFLNRSIDEEKQEVLGLSREMIEFRVVSEEAENNKRFYEMLLKKLQEATLSSGVTVTNIQIIDNAVVPKAPVQPNRSKNILLSVIVGLFGGVFLALFVDYMDDSVKNPDDVDNHLRQQFLGMVPSSPSDRKTYSDPALPIYEAYRTIRMGIKFAASQRPLKTVLITSSTPHEGKTTTASNLAVVLAQMGERVLLIDADLRRHNIHRQFDLDNSTGLGSVLMDPASASAAIKEVAEVPGLSVLTSGPLFPNPSEILASDHMKDLLASLRHRYDHIVIDSPPIMAVSDPLILSGLADGVIMVVQGGVTSKAVVNKACQTLTQINAHIVGVVLNNVKIPKRGYGYYYYSYYQSYASPQKDTVRSS